MGTAYLEWVAVHGRALPSKWSPASSNENLTNLSRRFNDAGVRVQRVCEGSGCWMMSRGQDPGESTWGGDFLQIWKSFKIIESDCPKATLVGMGCGEGIGELGWVLVEWEAVIESTQQRFAVACIWRVVLEENLRFVHEKTFDRGPISSFLLTWSEICRVSTIFKNYITKQI
jgi:hypothetical protein